jgi:hypothetical protein|tara:strand:+ start:461 stop:1378 length:918 start_codon:yes stop_codon:yes gene_type:complete
MAIKQSRGITIGKGTPQRLEGQNGDMTIRSSRRGLKLYVKESNKWHSLDLGIDLRQIASTVRRLEDEVKRLSTKTNNTPVVDKLLLRQSGGTSAVGIQNKSGKVHFRNSTDSADILVNDLNAENPVFTGDVKIQGGDLYGRTDAGLTVSVDTNFDVKLDVDNDGSGFFRILNGTGGLCLVVDESGGIQNYGKIVHKHTAFSTTGPTNLIDVSATTILEVDTSSNNVTIGGFAGGVQGQVLYIVKTDTTNFIQLEHNESPAAGDQQRIFLTSGADERVVGYGGYTLYCNGDDWYSLSNPTGAADAG